MEHVAWGCRWIWKSLRPRTRASSDELDGLVFQVGVAHRGNDWDKENFYRRYVRPRLLHFNGCAYTHEKVESKDFAMYYSMLCPKMHATRNGYFCVARAVKGLCVEHHVPWKVLLAGNCDPTWKAAARVSATSMHGWTLSASSFHWFASQNARKSSLASVGEGASKLLWHFG